MAGRNQEVIDLFHDLVRLTTLDEGGPASFRVRAYENAVREMEEYRGELDELSESALTKIEGIGKSTAKKIREYFDTGAIAKLETLRKKYPPAFVELTKIPGLGPKSVLTLRDRLGIENIDQLRAALEAQSIRDLEGFGPKKEENIARALERMGALGKNRRRSIAEALPLAEELAARLEAMPGVSRATVCGSLRRFRETIGDIDIVAVAALDGAAAVMEAFTRFPEVDEVVGMGETKSSVIVADGLQVDLRVVEADQVGAAILYFTGSKAHNIKLRQRAIARGWTLNEYGLTEIDSGNVVASATEEDIYRALELAWVPPPMREDYGEVEAAASGTLIEAAAATGLRGDWLVDAAGLDAAAAHAAGSLDYLVVAAPARSLPARRPKRKNGVSLAWAATVAPGEGAPDVDVDVVVVRVSEGASGDVTDALCRSLSDPGVHALAGATGRVVTRDDGASVDVDRLARVLAETGKVWIIDADLAHLDPSAEQLRRARGAGVKLALGSGAAADPLAALRYGPLHCQRGWVAADDLVNAWPVADVRALARRQRSS